MPLGLQAAVGLSPVRAPTRSARDERLHHTYGFSRSFIFAAVVHVRTASWRSARRRARSARGRGPPPRAGSHHASRR